MRIFLHFTGHILHLFQAGSDEPRQANDVGVFFFGLGQNLVARHHDAHVDHVKVVALKHHRHNVFANVVHVAFDGGNHNFALGFHVLACGLLLAFFFLDVRHQVRHGLLHHARRLDHLRQEHLALTKQIAHHIHAIHERAFDHVQGPAFFGQYFLIRLFGVFGNKVGDAMHQGMRQTRRHRDRRIRRAAPRQLLRIVFGCAFGVFSHFHQALTGIRPAVQDHVFHALTQVGFEFVVHAHHARIDNAHVHARLNGVVQKYGVNGFTHRVVAAKAKRHIGHTARYFGTWQILFDPTRGFNEIDGVVVVLFNAGSNGKNVGIENDVFGRKVHLVHQHAVGAFANFNFALVGIGLAFFIKRHDHRGSAIAFD